MAQQSQGEGSSKTSRGRLGGGSIATLIGIRLLVILVVQNTERIRFHFLIWHFSWPLWIYTLVTAIVGVWLGLGSCGGRRRRDRLARRGSSRTKAERTVSLEPRRLAIAIVLGLIGIALAVMALPMSPSIGRPANVQATVSPQKRGRSAPASQSRRIPPSRAPV
jgi:uncharacterized integral membrane protein